MKEKKIVRITYDCGYGGVQHGHGSECLCRRRHNRGNC